MRLAKAAELFCFNPRALTSPDKRSRWSFFREQSFNPRALTSPDHSATVCGLDVHVSIHGLLRALTDDITVGEDGKMFQSTGSYEP